MYSKALLLAAMVAGSSAFAPAPAFSRASVVLASEPKIGAGGMADTRDPETKVDEDPRKSISASPSFEEYMKQREAEGN
eukprot:CAMPEP_0195512218 /NCGR_PEP_ID=MMETSP0794_2-20130614/4246_1 /TAXON_ID=515487 /ORGANISM="Stephanopyxis turris, Strain CCMP 815" /LENGTH=78 /DNA_ID=CAMNT_0040639947 /DNA_START=36 /DNA_END=272 /DNA_ORIENTATION=-